MKKRVTVKAN